jgi:Protein of unknown function (DUF2939)
MRFALRHWTTILIVLLMAGWAIFYLPNTPAYAIFQLKQAIDARDGRAAAAYIDFKKVVENAGYEVVRNHNNGSVTTDASAIIAQLVGEGAVDMVSGPMASLLRQWSVQQVNDGAQQLQMPAAAVAGAAVLLHRHDGTAYTQWTERNGQVWELRMEQEADGWKIVQIKNIAQLLDKLKREQVKQLTRPAP